MSEDRHSLDPANPISHDEAREIAKRFIDRHFGNKNMLPYVSIPANVERDDDLRLMAYIRQNERLTRELAEATARAERAEAAIRAYLDAVDNSGGAVAWGFLRQLRAALAHKD